MSGDSPLEDPPAPPSEVRDWCLLTMTEGGKLSMLTGLAAGEAQIAAQAAAPYWMRPDAPKSSCYFGDSKHEIAKVMVFRGNGDRMNFWTGEVRNEPIRL